jgi:GrpB-like predicted nucleotidyltransferase (UPF0157 family)
MKEIIIEGYATEWPVTFEKLRSIYDCHLKGLIKDIQHVGSTSVPGLAAKPVIDIDIIIDAKNFFNEIIFKLSHLGYEYAGDQGIKDREAFKRISSYAPIDNSNHKWPSHNLYVCLDNGIALRNHIALRDFLRSHPEKAMEYAELKKKLVAENPYDIDLYIKNKTPFIIEILAAQGFDQNSLEIIKKENKA